jgi:hypothetical protein
MAAPTRETLRGKLHMPRTKGRQLTFRQQSANIGHWAGVLLVGPGRE